MPFQWTFQIDLKEAPVVGDLIFVVGPPGSLFSCQAGLFSLPSRLPEEFKWIWISKVIQKKPLFSGGLLQNKIHTKFLPSRNSNLVGFSVRVRINKVSTYVTKFLVRRFNVAPPTQTKNLIAQRAIGGKV